MDMNIDSLLKGNPEPLDKKGVEFLNELLGEHDWKISDPNDMINYIEVGGLTVCITEHPQIGELFWFQGELNCERIRRARINKINEKIKKLKEEKKSLLK